MQSKSTSSFKDGRISKISEATISRLPAYYRALTQLADSAQVRVSSEELAAITGVSSAMLRKDLSHLGSYGTRGVGYEVEFLRYQISREMGLNHDWKVVIVGVGNLGRALAHYGGFGSRGFRVVALVDSDQTLIGTKVKCGAEGKTVELLVHALSDLEDVIKETNARLGVVATPAESAQGVSDRLVKAGIRSILNFAPIHLSVPDGVDVRKVDLASELQILAFHEQRKAV
ncbi:MAG: redox-sensing transcriptional repressor Rex [Actinomycetota bacterium]|nr:redox-sensing transcriptional repressor Rex [Actinomycetota bacterium]